MKLVAPKQHVAKGPKAKGLGSLEALLSLTFALLGR